MTSHEYAKRLAELADWLLFRPEFEASILGSGPSIDFFPGSKENFLAAVRACGSGSKRTDSGLFIFQANTPAGTKLEINISQNRVCTLISPAETIDVSELVTVSKTVKEAEYKCEPLFSQEEVQEIGQ